MSGGLSEAIFSTTFSQSGSAAAAAGAAVAEAAAADDAVVVPEGPLDEPLSQAKERSERSAVRASVVFMVMADTAEPTKTFRGRLVAVGHATDNPWRSRRDCVVRVRRVGAPRSARLHGVGRLA